MSQITCQECTTTCFIKQHCASLWIKKVQINHLAKDTIFREGGYVEGIYIIQQGNVEVISDGADNKEQIIRFVTDGQLVGHRGTGDDKYPISATTLSNTTVCFIDNQTLQDAFINNPTLAVSIMMYY